MEKSTAVKTMKTLQIHGYGGPEQLLYEKVSVPEAKEGEVLVRVYAASVNPIDYKLASGVFRDFMPSQFPWTPGGDFSGVIESVGDGVAGFKEGDAVYGDTPHGGSYAEFVAVKASVTALKPKRLTFLEAASVPVAGQTAWQALFDYGHLEAGQTVLIHGASGGVGTFAVQLAHWKGGKVVATGSAENEEYLRSLGADQVILYEKTPFESMVKEVDLVLDLIGGDTLKRSIEVVKPGGALISTVQPPPEELVSRRKVRALMMRMKPSAENLMQLKELIDSDKIRTVVTRIYPLSQARVAWSESLTGHTRGKAVLEVMY